MKTIIAELKELITKGKPLPAKQVAMLIDYTEELESRIAKVYGDKGLPTSVDDAEASAE